MIASSITRIFSVILVSLDPAFSAVMSAMFERHADHALTTADLASARRALQTMAPSLILVDADSLPAPEAAISLMTICADAPVVAISAARQLSPPDATALYRAGAASVLFKTGGSSGIALLRAPQLLENLHAIAEAASDEGVEDAP